MAGYLCKNLTQCPTADARKVIDLPDGASLVCPDCQQSMLEPAAATRGGGEGGAPVWKRYLPIVAAVVVCVPLVYVAWHNKCSLPLPEALAARFECSPAPDDQPLPTPPSPSAGVDPAPGKAEQQPAVVDCNSAKAAGSPSAPALCRAEAIQLSNDGVAAMRRTAFDEAAVKYNQALEKDPGFGDASYNLAALFVRQGKLDEALTQLDNAFKNNFTGGADVVDKDPVFDPLRNHPTLGPIFKQKVEAFSTAKKMIVNDK